MVSHSRGIRPAWSLASGDAERAPSAMGPRQFGGSLRGFLDIRIKRYEIVLKGYADPAGFYHQPANARAGKSDNEV